jgi:hypothetical protein
MMVGREVTTDDGKTFLWLQGSTTGHFCLISGQLEPLRTNPRRWLKLHWVPTAWKPVEQPPCASTSPFAPACPCNDEEKDNTALFLPPPVPHPEHLQTLGWWPLPSSADTAAVLGGDSTIRHRRSAPLSFAKRRNSKKIEQIACHQRSFRSTCARRCSGLSHIDGGQVSGMVASPIGDLAGRGL